MSLKEGVTALAGPVLPVSPGDFAGVTFPVALPGDLAGVTFPAGVLVGVTFTAGELGAILTGVLLVLFAFSTLSAILKYYYLKMVLLLLAMVVGWLGLLGWI